MMEMQESFVVVLSCFLVLVGFYVFFTAFLLIGGYFPNCKCAILIVMNQWLSRGDLGGRVTNRKREREEEGRKSLRANRLQSVERRLEFTALCYKIGFKVIEASPMGTWIIYWDDMERQDVVKCNGH